MVGRVALCLAWSVLACGDRDPYVCASHDQCIDDGRQGVCEPTGFCSFESEACGGRQYEPNAGNGLDGTCVCGGLGQPCCETGPACNSSAISCVAGRCESCVDDLGYGQTHACMLKRDRSVWCIGDNDRGQIGNGTIDAAAPVLQWTAVRDVYPAPWRHSRTATPRDARAMRPRPGARVGLASPRHASAPTLGCRSRPETAQRDR